MTIVNGKTHQLYPRNPHIGRYNFGQLIQALPALKKFQKLNPKGEPTIDFSDGNAVLSLNKALLTQHYGVKFWDLPQGYLCPPIPGRADYIHHIADLLLDHTSKLSTSHTSTKKGKKIHALDIGTGANCIYPIIGSQSYGWRFTATDIDPVSVNTAKAICTANANLKPLIRIKHQKQPEHIFHGVIGQHDYFDITLCNPPFHASLDDAMAANARKRHKLKHHQRKRQRGKQVSNVSAQANRQNFGGQKAELWCNGGEIAFLKRMAHESKDFAEQVGWFTSLVSKAENIKPLERILETLNVDNLRVIPMKHGQKTTRILAWKY